MKWPSHYEATGQVYQLVFNMISLCYVVEVSTVVWILPVFSTPYLCSPCLLTVMMPQLQDHTADVPYRGPCLSHHVIFWQLDCMYGTTESSPCSLGLTLVEFSLWNSWSMCHVSSVTCISICQEAVNKVDGDTVLQGYHWDRCSITRGVHVK